MIKYPDKFLEVRVQSLSADPTQTTLCAGFDLGEWRASKLADYMFDWLPYAALSQENQLEFGSHNFGQMLHLAAAHIYNTKKTSTRGELGELLLHIACVSHFQTVPVLCKLILKTSSNDNVKGFDGVHLIKSSHGFEVWLGESKFFEDPKHAIREAVSSVQAHILPSFLDTEKAMIFGHVAPGIPHREELVKLFKVQTPKDALLAMSVFPILIAYESSAVSSFDAIAKPYVEALEAEVASLMSYWGEKANGLTLRFNLIFVPLGSKKLVVDRFDQKSQAFL